mgnify:CR=1 FL=1
MFGVSQSIWIREIQKKLCHMFIELVNMKSLIYSHDMSSTVIMTAEE